MASPWVESKLRSQLESLSGESPVFGLIGLMDAHEPYIGTELGRLSPIEYLRLLTTRQDRDGWFQGRWKPSPSELANLEWLYLRTIETLDRRVGRILEALRASRPGENSVIVVMSDHGQMFSAQDTIFHAGLLEEEVVRVPLAIQFPHARHSGKRSTQWVSTVDVMPTILSEAGIPAKWTTDGLVLGAAQEEVRSTPVWTLSDGYTIGTGKRIPQERLDWLDRFGLLAISVEGRLQLPFDVDDASSVGRLGTEESTKSVPPDLGGLRQQMLEIQTLICRQVAGRGRGQPDPMAVGDARVRPQYDSSPNG
ncbi:MAG: sulfatase-like hydrolase/transferase [Thermoplasmata archaeon]